MTNAIETAGVTAIDTIALVNFAVLKGKGVKAAHRYADARRQGANALIMVAAGAFKKETIIEMESAGLDQAAQLVADGKYRDVIVSLAAAAKVPFAFVCDRETGDVRRADWKDLEGRLAALTSKQGAAVLATYERIQRAADEIHAARRATQPAIA